MAQRTCESPSSPASGVLLLPSAVEAASIFGLAQARAERSGQVTATSEGRTSPICPWIAGSATCCQKICKERASEAAAVDTVRSTSSFVNPSMPSSSEQVQPKVLSSTLRLCSSNQSIVQLWFMVGHVQNAPAKHHSHSIGLRKTCYIY